MSDPALFAVTGSPVLHSKSPLIFSHFFSNKNIDALYTRIAANTPEEAIFLFRELGLKGMNVTSPFKREMMDSMDFIDPFAEKIGGINTVVREGNILKGYNTDFTGVVDSFKNRGIKIKGKKCVVLGAGGAGRAAVYGMIRENADVTVVNRTYENAVQVAETFDCKARKIEDLGVILKSSDIFISTIPSGSDIIEPEWIHDKLVVFDAIYPESPVYRMAKNGRSTTLKGEEWLFNQAVHAYKKFLKQNLPESTIKKNFLTDFKIHKKENITFIGFMGCGKTAIGERVSKKIGFSFKDTDSSIEKGEQTSIFNIFNTKGEDYFREKEKLEITELVKKKRFVYSCGGGAVIDASNRKVLRENSVVVWLYSSIDSCLGRIKKGTRPLLDVKDPVTEAEKIFKQRLPYYFRVSDLIVNADKNMDEVVKKITEEITRVI